MGDEHWVLILYVMGMTPTAKSALLNLTTISEQHMKGRYSLEVIDLGKQPGVAQRDQIFGVPTLVRRNPLPERKLIGDLSNREKVLAALQIGDYDAAA